MYISALPGRYGEDFVEKRRQKLQMWSNRIARHPVLSRCEVIEHFFLCDDEGVSGERREEGREREEAPVAAPYTCNCPRIGEPCCST